MPIHIKGSGGGGGLTSVTSENVVAFAANWLKASGSTTPNTNVCSYYQEIEVDGMTDSNNVIVSLGQTANDTQKTAAQDAKIFAHSQNGSKMVMCVYTDGTLPTVDIPINVLILEYEGGTDISQVTLESWAALNGYDFYNQNGAKVEGQMQTISPSSISLTSTGQTYIIPEGYHTGSSTVTANVTQTLGSGLTDVTATTLEPWMALQGYYYYNANDELVEGEMPNLGGGSVVLDMNTPEYYPEFGYYDGTGSVKIVPQTKTIMPAPWQQWVYPNEGNVLKSVTIQGMGASGVTTYNVYQAWASTGDGENASSLTFNIDGIGEVLDSASGRPHIFVYLKDSGQVSDDSIVYHPILTSYASWGTIYGNHTSSSVMGSTYSSSDLTSDYSDNEITVTSPNTGRTFYNNAQYCLLLVVCPSS